MLIPYRSFVVGRIGLDCLSSVRKKLKFIEDSTGWLLIQEIVDKISECWNNSSVQDMKNR